MESVTMRLLLYLGILVSADGILVTVPDLGYILGTQVESTWTNRTIYAFYGIRFALAPSGSRRFMPPEPYLPDNEDEYYNATVLGRDCPYLLKKDFRFSAEEDLEDCLTLNVYTPYIPDFTNDDTKLLPVMVLIYGGGFYEGSPRYFPPNYLLDKDVLLVVVQYRLGPLGFMSLQTDGIAGNVGFMDQVLALKWVNKNIESFGGDKNQVTVFGQSAGGASISLLLMSPMVDRDLFQRAILQSGAALSSWVIDENPTIFAKALFQVLTNVTEDVSKDIIESRFKNATLEEIHTAVLSLVERDPSKLAYIGRAVVQNAGKVKFLDDHPENIVRQGKVRPVPMMAGVTTHDGSYLITELYDQLELFNLVNNSDYLRHNLTSDMLKMLEVDDISGSYADTLENKYFKKIFDEERDLNFIDITPGIIDIAGMGFFKAPILKHAKINSMYKKSTFLYTFDYKGEFTRFGYGKDTSKYPFDGGVHHSDDLLYLFPYHYNSTLNEDDTKIAKMMVDIWTSFAITGIPNSQNKLDDWLPIRPGKNGPYYHINSTCHSDQDFIDLEYIAATNYEIF